MIVTRFAPSPTGLLHLGHAFAALMAAAAGERFLLRIEDIDASRARTEFEGAIFEDLAWLGLVWEMPALKQSTRFPAYRASLESLRSRGLLYPCFCTRKEIADEIEHASAAPHGPEGPHYPGTCRRLSENERERRLRTGAEFAWRLDSARAANEAGKLSFVERGEGPNGEHGEMTVEPTRLGDIVLARKDTPTSYHLAVVVDDAFQGVSLVTRGNDLFAATHVQRLLQALLELSVPEYAHHRLIMDARGRKLSKRDHALSLKALRESGVTPTELRERIGLGARR